MRKHSLAPSALRGLALVTISALFVACASAEKTASPEPVAPPVSAEPAAGHVDLDKLQETLGLNGAREDVGYNEKSFGTCEMGYGFSRSRDCRTQFLVVLRFQLQCRESEGTSADVVDQQIIHPIRSDKVRWNLGTSQGYTKTDPDGYGVVRFLAPRSQKRERAKLTVDGRYLVMRAEDMSRMVAPANWCGGTH